MRHRFRPPNPAWLLPGVLGAAFSLAFAQYPGHIDTQKKAASTLRSVAVLEWTGSPGHPSASRLIPIAVFDGENYQPGGLYLARPEPLALDSGTEYILQSAGIPQGLFDVNTAQDVEGSWIGYGVWRNLVLPSIHKLPNSKNMPQVVRDAGAGGPHLNSSSGQSAGSGQNSSASDSGPVLVRRAGSEDGSSTGSGSSQQGTASTGSASGSSPTSTNSGSSGNGGSASGQNPAPVDPDRPVLVRRTDDSSTGSGGSSQGGAASSSGSAGTGSSSTPSSGGAGPSSSGGAGASGSAGESAPVDPDRPVLRRRSDSTASSAPSYLPQGPETATGGADPDRPHLTRGSSNPEDSQSFEEPKLTGAPPNLQQMVAVSDAEDREPHPFAYGWSSPSDEAKMKSQMEALAQTALAPPASKTPAKRPAARTAAARRAHLPAAHALPQLSNERFAAYQLTYDSGATLILTAESTPASGKTQYITLIAQPDFYGVPHVIFTSTTTAGMFDLTPDMQLVDVVDARANNRGDLIFELRSSHTRQFAIYRVVEGQVEQVFVTAPMPLSATQASAAASSS
ncbi:MAG TPA: hypothetical protein VHX11_02110 [Acidobacteriaceae bacterium]|nr:hypothetical protein [Acidobacteriaceae bacterium]